MLRAQGHPRATADIDVWVAIQPTNAQRIVEVLKEFGFGVPELSTDLFLRENRIIRMGLPPVRIEITTTISGVTFDECYQARVEGTIDDVQVNIISLHYLKINKKASGRHKDLNDLQHLA